MTQAHSIRVLLALLMGILLMIAGIKGNLGSMLAAFIDPSALSLEGHSTQTGSTTP